MPGTRQPAITPRDGIVGECAGAWDQVNGVGSCHRREAQRDALDRGGDLGRTMRNRFACDRVAHCGPKCHRPREEAKRDARRSFLDHGLQLGEKRATMLREGCERQSHRLVRGLGGTDERTERLESDMPIEPELPRRAGDHRDVVAERERVTSKPSDEAAKDEALSAVLRGRKQANLTWIAAWRQMAIEIGQLAVKRERPLRAKHDHADESRTTRRDDIGVLVMEAVDEATLGVRRMLRNFLDEGLVVEAMDRLELPRLARHANIE
jgi:hypothetical protein